jgi:hypothetical protein
LDKSVIPDFCFKTDVNLLADTLIDVYSNAHWWAFFAPQQLKEIAMSDTDTPFDRANPPALPVWVYHGTGPDAFAAIEEEGIDPDSYWAGNYEQAKFYADSFGAEGIVLACRIGDYDFEANRLVAECLYRQDELSESDIPDERELAYSLELFEGIVCRDRIYRYEVVTGPMTPDAGVSD